MSKLNPYSLKKLIHQFGLLNKDISPTPSLCLGVCDASVAEMVSAYTTFVGKGIRTSPLLVTHIEDNAGNIVATFSATKTEVISEESSYKMIEMLRAVVNEGTGGRIRRVYGIKADMGAKTGTTQNNSDGWFMGFTPSLVTGCWVGGEERDIHFDRMSEGQGAAVALPIWGLYMNKVYADETLPYSQEEKFELPENFDPCGDSRYISVSDDSDAEDDINDADAVLEEDDVNVVVSKSLKKSAEIEVEAVEDFFE
jgi:penicillin-binding protein 1A